MKIIKKVRSSIQQEQTQKYGDEAHILLNERVVEIDNNDESTSTQYEYDKVIVNECSRYADVVAVATEFYEEEMKEEQLNSIVVEVQSGKKFYGDSTSRADMADAIKRGEETNISSTLWKLAEPIDGEKCQEVTISELREARDLALEAKGAIIGVVAS